ncbi:unnamed protein product, partial [Laminaria digitata]
ASDPPHDDSIVACEITIMYSVALRAARLPSKALLAIQNASQLSTEMAPGRRAIWEREAATVLLQMGRLREAAVRLKNALYLGGDDVRVLQPLGAALVVQGSVAEGFRYLRAAADIQRSRIATLFESIVSEKGLDPSILETTSEEEVLVTQRDWMTTFLSLSLRGRWGDLGSSVHVLRRVDNFLKRHFSMDSEISFMLGRDLSKRGFQRESWNYLTSAAAPWNRQACCGMIYRIRAALSFPAVPSSEQELALTMATLDCWLYLQEPSIDNLRDALPCPSPPNNRQSCTADGEQNSSTDSSSSGSCGGGGGSGQLFSCSFGGLNYPDVAFDNLPLLGFADYRVRRRQRRPPPPRRFSSDNGGDGDGDYNGGRREGGGGGEATASAAAAAAEAAAEEEEEEEEEAVEDREDDYVSPYGPIGRLFSRLCPDLGAYVEPWLDKFAGESGLSPRDRRGRLAGTEGRVKVVFISSRFGNYGPTKALAGLMRLLPRDYFEVIPSAWPTPVDDWTEEHVLADQVHDRPLNLTLNRTSSLERLAKRRPDVVVFADASLDMKTYFLAFGRVAPVQVSL